MEHDARNRIERLAHSCRHDEVIRIQRRGWTISRIEDGWSDHRHTAAVWRPWGWDREVKRRAADGGCPRGEKFGTCQEIRIIRGDIQSLNGQNICAGLQVGRESEFLNGARGVRIGCRGMFIESYWGIHSNDFGAIDKSDKA